MSAPLSTLSGRGVGILGLPHESAHDFALTLTVIVAGEAVLGWSLFRENAALHQQMLPADDPAGSARLAAAQARSAPPALSWRTPSPPPPRPPGPDRRGPGAADFPKGSAPR